MKRRETGSQGKKIAFRQVIVSPVGSLSSHFAVCVPVTIARQFGRGNMGVIAQTGSSNSACLIQSGRNLDGAIVQSGDNLSAGLLQTRWGTSEIPADACASVTSRRQVFAYIAGRTETLGGPPVLSRGRRSH